MYSFIHGAVCPAVIIPCMIKLLQRHLGIDKAIPSIVIMSSGLENLIPISGTVILICLLFSKGEHGFIA